MPRGEWSRAEPGRRSTAVAALLVAVAVWGGSFVVVKSGVRSAPVFDFLVLRFLFAAVVLTALAARRGELRAALAQRGPWVLGALLFAALALQTAGLQTTSPADSAFVTSLSVLVVPFLVWVSTRTAPTRRSWCAALLATAGLALIFSGSTGHWRGGDALTALCAVAFAAYVVEAGRIAPGVAPGASVIGSVAVQSVLCLALSLPCAALASGGPPTGAARSEVLWAAAYAGIAATALAYGLQLFAQRRVGPIEAAILLSLEPAAATATSVLLGQDTLTPGLALGGCLLLIAAISVDRPCALGSRSDEHRAARHRGLG